MRPPLSCARRQYNTRMAAPPPDADSDDDVDAAHAFPPAMRAHMARCILFYRPPWLSATQKIECDGFFASIAKPSIFPMHTFVNAPRIDAWPAVHVTGTVYEDYIKHASLLVPGSALLRQFVRAMLASTPVGKATEDECAAAVLASNARLSAALWRTDKKKMIRAFRDTACVDFERVYAYGYLGQIIGNAIISSITQQITCKTHSVYVQPKEEGVCREISVSAVRTFMIDLKCRLGVDFNTLMLYTRDRACHPYSTDVQNAHNHILRQAIGTSALADGSLSPLGVCVANPAWSNHNKSRMAEAGPFMRAFKSVVRTALNMRYFHVRVVVCARVCVRVSSPLLCADQFAADVRQYWRVAQGNIGIQLRIPVDGESC